MSRHLSGHKAKGAGDAFEQLFLAICNRGGIACVDFPDGAYRVRTPYGLKLVPCEMPFDYIICKDRKAAAVDAKTTEEKSFSYSMITQHQVASLSSVGRHIPAGYVVWFRTIDEVIFFEYNILANVQPRTSLKPEQGVSLGSIGSADFNRILNHEPAAAEQQRTLF